MNGLQHLGINLNTYVLVQAKLNQPGVSLVEVNSHLNNEE